VSKNPVGIVNFKTRDDTRSDARALDF
jgi:hypothetical protein